VPRERRTTVSLLYFCDYYLLLRIMIMIIDDFHILHIVDNQHAQAGATDWFHTSKSPMIGAH
jgi:hypothetical protein